MRAFKPIFTYDYAGKRVAPILIYAPIPPLAPPPSLSLKIHPYNAYTRVLIHILLLTRTVSVDMQKADTRGKVELACVTFAAASFGDTWNARTVDEHEYESIQTVGK